GDLERVEAAPRLAHHPDRARAPRLGSEPADDRDAVVELLLVVLVQQEAVRVARAAHVDAHRGIAVPGAVAVHRLLPPPRPGPPAVGEVLEEGGHGRALP